MSNDLSGDVGLDAKYGITQSLTANLTLNTDFAQVEADEQQVNLTRFSLFFPEKREFFLENQGLFGFGAPGRRALRRRRADPLLQPPDRVEQRPRRADPGRRAADGQGGALRHRRDQHRDRRDDAASAPPTNFTVLRLKRDVLRRSNVGLIFTRTGRSDSH